MTFKPVENPIFTYTLNRNIQYLGQEISEIALREPTAGDVFRVGNPVKYDVRLAPPSLEFDEDKAFKMLS